MALFLAHQKGIDMRIVRTIFLLAAATYFMPSPPEERFGVASDDNRPVTELVSAAVSTVADMSDFCSRQASVCDTAHYLAVKLEGKAKYSIELLYQWAQDLRGPTAPDPRSRRRVGHGREHIAPGRPDTRMAGTAGLIRHS